MTERAILERIARDIPDHFYTYITGFKDNEYTMYDMEYDPKKRIVYGRFYKVHAHFFVVFRDRIYVYKSHDMPCICNDFDTMKFTVNYFDRYDYLWALPNSPVTKYAVPKKYLGKHVSGWQPFVRPAKSMSDIDIHFI